MSLSGVKASEELNLSVSLKPETLDLVLLYCVLFFSIVYGCSEMDLLSTM